MKTKFRNTKEVISFTISEVKRLAYWFSLAVPKGEENRYENVHVADSQPLQFPCRISLNHTYYIALRRIIGGLSCDKLYFIIVILLKIKTTFLKDCHLHHQISSSSNLKVLVSKPEPGECVHANRDAGLPYRRAMRVYVVIIFI